MRGANGSMLSENIARVFTVDIFSLDFSDYLEDPPGPTHGSELDTSLMLYLAPELVRMDLAQDFPLTERQVERFRRRAAASVPALSPGSVGRPTLASAEKGARLYKMIHDRIATRFVGPPAPPVPTVAACSALPSRSSRSWPSRPSTRACSSCASTLRKSRASRYGCVAATSPAAATGGRQGLV